MSLEARLAHLEAVISLDRLVDAAMESAFRAHEPLGRTLPKVLPHLRDACGAAQAWVHTFDESLEMRTFACVDGGAECDRELVAAALASGGQVPDGAGGTVLADRIDVAGEDFGFCAIQVEGRPDDARAEALLELVHTFSEEIDDRLAAISRARKKASLARTLARSFESAVLDTGLAQALETMSEALPSVDVLVAYRHRDDVPGGAPHAMWVKGGEVRALTGEEASGVLDEDDATLRTLGFDSPRYETQLGGVRGAAVMGRIVARTSGGPVPAHDVDLLDVFADLLRQRVVDFGREWRHLSLTFPRSVVRRLLADGDYRERWLSPREHEVAILFADISGFTRVSEQVLKTPERIGRLVDVWSAQVVEAIWAEGGVFDKMVGDCVIALFGPPFFEATPEECCQAAVRAGLRIREMTRALAASGEVPGLDPGRDTLGVATGINFAPLFVGFFGPNDDYTGFSSGMNNTARLQGVATRDETLCMESVVKLVEGSFAFGEAREAPVKNVAEPLRFRALED